MKKLFIFLVILLLVPGIVTAAYKTVHDAWHPYKDTFVVGDDVYKIELNHNDFNVLVFTANDYTTIINERRCKSVNEFKYCYEAYDMNNSKRTISERGILMPGVQIVIEKDEIDQSKITETNTFDKTVYLSKSYNINTVLKNTGPAWATAVTYEITIPDGVEITNKRTFQQTGNKLVYSTALSPGSSNEVSFDYKPKKYGDLEFKYIIFYEDYVSRKNKTGTIKPNAPLPYKVTATFSKPKVDINTMSNLNIKIENTDLDRDLVVKNLMVSGRPDLIYNTDSNFYFHSAGIFAVNPVTIRPKDSKEFTLRVTPQYTGKHNFTGYLEFEHHGFTLENNFTRTLDTTVDGVQVDFFLNKNDILAGSDIDFYLTIRNTNNNLFFTDVKLELTSDFYSETFTIEKLNPVSAVELLQRKTVTIPMTDENVKYKVDVKTSFKTTGGQIKTLENSQQITSTGSGTILKLTQNIRPLTVNPGGEIIVETSVKNLKENYFDLLKVNDFFPEEMSVVVGAHSYTGTLARQQDIKVYTYKIKVPETYRQETFNIKTVAELPNHAYVLEESKTIKVNATDTVPVVVNDPSQDDDGGVDVINTGGDEEEKPGFFKRLINSIDAFFSKLFGK